MGVHPKTIKNDYFKGQNDGNMVILLGVAPRFYTLPPLFPNKSGLPRLVHHAGNERSGTFLSVLQ